MPDRHMFGALSDSQESRAGSSGVRLAVPPRGSRAPPSVVRCCLLVASPLALLVSFRTSKTRSVDRGVKTWPKCARHASLGLLRRSNSMGAPGTSNGPAAHLLHVVPLSMEHVCTGQQKMEANGAWQGGWTTGQCQRCRFLFCFVVGGASIAHVQGKRTLVYGP